MLMGIVLSYIIFYEKKALLVLYFIVILTHDI